jgi:hypothetical protein
MMTDQLDALKNYLEQIHFIFKQHGLINVIQNGHYLKKFSDDIGHLRPKYNKNGEVDFQQEDLLLIVHETRFAIANTLLLFEIGLTKFKISQSGYGPVGQFFSTEFDTRFFYFVDDVFMRLYNFWNRVANFINIFFQIETDPEKVYFAPMMDKMINCVKSDPNFQSLKIFRDIEFKDIINKKRKVVVHRESSSATYFKIFFKNVQNPQELSKLQQERDELPQFFVLSYKRMIQGIDEMLALIKDNVR